MRSHCLTLLALFAAACGDASGPSAPPGGDDAGMLPRLDGSPAVDAGASDATEAPCITATVGTNVFSCGDFGVTVAAPALCSAQSCPILLDIHGLGMSADAEDANTNLRALGNAAGFIVVQPTAPSRTVYGPTWLNTDDDAVWAAFMQAKAAWKADDKRVHVTGFSQGGYMAWRLLCEHSDVLASVAPGAAGVDKCPADNFNTTCAFTGASVPKAPIDVLFVAGNQDAIVPPSCTAPQIAAVVAAWGGTKTKIDGDGSFERDRYTGAAGNDFEVLTHDYTTDPAGLLASNKGHCYPGATPKTGTVWDAVACKPPNSFAWGQEVLQFFIAHPKK